MAAAAPAAASGMGQESVAERRTSEGTRQTSVGPAADQRPPKPDEDKGEALAIMKELENPQNVKRLFEPFQKVVRVMQYYIDDSEIQLKGCFVLSLSCVTHFRYVLKCGGLKALLGAMKRFPLDVRLQASGLEALRTLCWTWDGAFQVLHEGGIEATLATAANLPEDEIVQQEAIGVLTTLAARNAEAVLNARGYEFILRGMADHPTSWVQAWGCEALRLFAEQDHKRLDHEYCMDLIQSAEKNNPKSEAVQQFAEEADCVIRQKFGLPPKEGAEEAAEGEQPAEGGQQPQQQPA